MRSFLNWIKRILGMSTVKCKGSKTVTRARKGDDGKGIVSQVDYYGLSSSAGTQPTSWSAGVIPLMTQTMKYLWKYTRTTYSDGTYVDTTPGIVGVFGDSGLSYRYSKWEEGFEYRNDNNPFYRDSEGKGVVDVVFEDDITIWDPATDPNNPPAAWVCRQTHTSSSSKPLPNAQQSNIYWSAMNSMAPILTALVLARKIRADEIDVDSLIAKHVQVKSGNNVIADMGGNSSYPFFMGASTPANAKTKIDNNGYLYCSGGVFSGNLRLPFQQIGESHTLTVNDPSSILMCGVMGNNILTLPVSSTGAFNGWSLNVFSFPVFSRMDSELEVQGHILVPEKCTGSYGEMATLYFASAIHLGPAGGLMQFMCISKQWVLVNVKSNPSTIQYTQSSNSSPDW